MRAIAFLTALFLSTKAWADAVPGQGAGFGYHDHMWGGGWGGMFLGPFFMILSLVAVIVLVVWIVRWLGPTGETSQGGSSKRSARQILEERYAHGEIDTEEYRERKKELGD